MEGPIGRGGVGEVLLVTDHDLRRQIAMKVLVPEAAEDEEARLEFVAEAQATSQLEHPGVAHEFLAGGEVLDLRADPCGVASLAEGLCGLDYGLHSPRLPGDIRTCASR